MYPYNSSTPVNVGSLQKSHITFRRYTGYPPFDILMFCIEGVTILAPCLVMFVNRTAPTSA